MLQAAPLRSAACRIHSLRLLANDSAAALKQLEERVSVFFIRSGRLTPEACRSAALTVASRNGDKFHQFESHFILIASFLFLNVLFLFSHADFVLPR